MQPSLERALRQFWSGEWGRALGFHLDIQVEADRATTHPEAPQPSGECAIALVLQAFQKIVSSYASGPAQMLDARGGACDALLAR